MTLFASALKSGLTFAKSNAFLEQALMIRRPAVQIIKDAETLNDKSEFDLAKYIICKSSKFTSHAFTLFSGF